MALLRTLSTTILAAVFATASASIASANPPPWAHGQLQIMGGFARSHAVVSGKVVGVDFASGNILVETPRGRVPIAVTPSTNIFRGEQFASFAEVGRGAHVDVDVSDVGGRLVAQIIRIH